jgi:hypothetical protein
MMQEEKLELYEEAEEGTVVADGNHVVPKGVAVEELDGGKQKLVDECPPLLKELLEGKNLFDVYDRFVKAVDEESHTRGFFGRWQDQEIVGIIDLFRDDFAEQGVKVALCKRRSGGGTFRWLEFIDTDVADTYVPQFDVANRSGQVIKTVFTKLSFPNGVAVEEFKQWGKKRARLSEQIPIYVEKMMEKKGLMVEYQALVDDCAEAGVGANTKMWNIEKLKAIADAHKPKFAAKGVDVFISHKQEYVSHGRHGGHTEFYRWIEFVDREEQPNYSPQRDADSKKQEICVIS